VGGARQWLKKSALRVWPSATTTLVSIRSRRLSHRLVEGWGLHRVDDRLIERQGLVVAAGPFAGLRLPEATRAEHLGPFLLGTYESELHGWLDELRGAIVAQVIDVGAKFGYYAVGLARWWPEARSIAFDTDPWARRVLRQTASLNGVRNFEVRGSLKAGALAGLVRPPALIVSDCEGFEAELFTATRAEALRDCWLLVELHPEAAPGVEDLLGSHLASTHAIEVREREERAPPALLSGVLTGEEARLAVHEFRGEQRWMFCRPLRAAAPVE
jgi:hypothetical protein